MRIGYAVALAMLGVGSVGAALYVFGALPWSTAPSSEDRDAIRTVTGIVSALVAPLAVYIAWRSAVTSRAALLNQTVPVLVDIPEYGPGFDETSPVVVDGQAHMLAEREARVITVPDTEGGTRAHGLVLPVRNVGNGTARMRRASLHLGSQELEGKFDRHVVPEDEAVRLLFEIMDQAPRQALQHAMGDPSERLTVAIEFTDASGREGYSTDIALRVGEPLPEDPVRMRALNVVDVVQTA